MKVTVRASTGAGVVVWRQGDSYYARLLDEVSDPEICLGVDLFEVIAELAGLDLDDEHHAREAVELANEAQRELLANAELDGTPEKRDERGRYR